VATAATAVVDGLESTSSYLREKKFEHLAKDVTALVRIYPVQSLLIGVGLGSMALSPSRVLNQSTAHKLRTELSLQRPTAEARYRYGDAAAGAGVGVAVFFRRKL
jgi:hypothetical protein